jgi:predicted transcriptional regulator
MSERRSKLEIVGDILKAIQAKGGMIKPTHLLYKSNLSHERMKLYVDELKSKGMLEEKEAKGKRMFSVTDKGLDFLASYRKVVELEDAFGI